MPIQLRPEEAPLTEVLQGRCRVLGNKNPNFLSHTLLHAAEVWEGKKKDRKFMFFGYFWVHAWQLARRKFIFIFKLSWISGTGGLGDMKLTYGTRLPGTIFRTRKADKVIIFLFIFPFFFSVSFHFRILYKKSSKIEEICRFSLLL